MQNLRLIPLLLLLAISPAVAARTVSQEPGALSALKRQAVRVYLDCQRCDEDFIRTEITFVNYVWDRKDAQVHILVTSQPTGSGGMEYTITFMGQETFAGKNDTLRFVAREHDTEDTVRKGLTRMLKLGLMSYVARTPLADQLTIAFNKEVTPTAVDDKWNHWVFRLNANTTARGEDVSNAFHIGGSINANRITEDLKIRLFFSQSHSQENYIIEQEAISKAARTQSFMSTVVRSLTDHWSAGAWFGTLISTYSNIRFSATIAPALEYNLFPYSQSTRRELRFLYNLRLNTTTYFDTTKYDEINERLNLETLSITLKMNERWGTVETTLMGSHYFHDFSKNRLVLSSNLRLHLMKGFSLNINGSVESIHDQLSLPKHEPSEEDILLRQMELETDFRYSCSLGFSYTFGSIYNNVVNPRFGS